MGWEVLGLGVAVDADGVEGHLVFLVVDDVVDGVDDVGFLLTCEHALEYAVVDSGAVLF